MTFPRRLVWVIAWAGLPASIVLGGLTYRSLRTVTAETNRARVRAEAALVAGELAHPRSTELQTLSVEYGRHLQLRVTLLDAEGNVLGDSAMDRAGVASMDNHRSRPEVQQAAATGTGESLRHSVSTGLEFLYVARRVEGAGPIAVVRLALPAAVLTEPPTGVLLPVLAPTLGIGLVLAIAFLRSRRLAAQLTALTRDIEEESRSTEDHPLRAEGDDDLALLAGAVNHLRRSLVRRIATLRQEQLLGSAVIAEMREGLLVVGADRRILLANDALRRIFGIAADPSGRLVAEVIRAPAVIKDLDEILDEGRDVAESVFHAPDSGRTFEVRMTPLRSEAAEALILFFDITRLEVLESVRRDFVANVSHELRTPLTSIKAFVETLVDGGVEDQANAVEFLRIVRKHANRMEELIDDLTDLSLIETGSIQLDLDDLDAREVAREVAQQMPHRHPASDVTVRVDLPSPFRVRADRRRLEQVLVNLVDNAVKFSRPGGEVRVTGEMTPDRARISVEDDGVGIPADSLEKVFHRFYRVDKARSRDVGGTGLGLAIVKHLMRLHGGTVSVESEVGRGSKFHLEFVR